MRRQRWHPLECQTHPTEARLCAPDICHWGAWYGQEAGSAVLYSVPALLLHSRWAQLFPAVVARDLRCGRSCLAGLVSPQPENDPMGQIRDVVDSEYPVAVVLRTTRRFVCEARVPCFPRLVSLKPFSRPTFPSEQACGWIVGKAVLEVALRWQSLNRHVQGKVMVWRTRLSIRPIRAPRFWTLSARSMTSTSPRKASWSPPMSGLKESRLRTGSNFPIST